MVQLGHKKSRRQVFKNKINTILCLQSNHSIYVCHNFYIIKKEIKVDMMLQQQWSEVNAQHDSLTLSGRRGPSCHPMILNRLNTLKNENKILGN